MPLSKHPAAFLFLACFTSACGKSDVPQGASINSISDACTATQDFLKKCTGRTTLAADHDTCVADVTASSAACQQATKDFATCLSSKGCIQIATCNTQASAVSSHCD